MPLQRDMDRCQIFGCRNPQHEEASVTFMVPNAGEKTARICLFHLSMVQDPNMDYSIGITLRGDTEIRPIPVAPPPSDPAPSE